MIPHPEPADSEELARQRWAAVRAARLKLDALMATAPPGSFEFTFLRRDTESFTDFDFGLLERLAWHYRRRIPRSLAPKLNPDDPIVRENHGP